MKRLFALVFSALFLFTAYASENEKIETWRIMELKFSSGTDYTEAGADGIWMDVEFIHERTRQSIVRPAFWDGERSFIVRFAQRRRASGAI